MQAENVDEVVKVKSMATDEIGLNEALAAAGVAALETDLAELIVQLAGRRAVAHRRARRSTRTAPRSAISSAIAFDQPELTDDPPALAEAARLHLRERFMRAEVAISGANFAVAETGTIAVVESEGNGRMCTTLPRVLITVMGIEKVLPRFGDLEVFLQLLPRSATGERMNPYTSLWSGVRAGDGPEAFHLVLLDNGRTRVLADPVGRQALACIRCGACLNVCPVYGRTGGHAYRSVYPGPIGAILTPMLEGIEGRSSLPFASTLCGACFDACPVRIDIPEVLLHLRAKAVESAAGGHADRGEAASMKLVAWIFGSPRRMAAAEAAGLPIARLLQRIGLLGRLPGPLALLGRAARAPAHPAARAALEVAALSARDEVLGRVRDALRDVPADERPEDVPIDRAYGRTHRARRAPRRSSASPSASPTTGPTCAGAPRATRRAPSRRRSRCTARAASGCRTTCPPALRPAGVELVDDAGLATRGADGLEGLDGVVTTCSLAIAETGTICLDGRRGRRPARAHAGARPARLRRARRRWSRAACRRASSGSRRPRARAGRSRSHRGRRRRATSR